VILFSFSFFLDQDEDAEMAEIEALPAPRSAEPQYSQQVSIGNIHGPGCHGVIVVLAASKVGTDEEDI
jgi:hypothetical protein